MKSIPYQWLLVSVLGLILIFPQSLAAKQGGQQAFGSRRRPADESVRRPDLDRIAWCPASRTAHDFRTADLHRKFRQHAN